MSIIFQICFDNASLSLDNAPPSLLTKQNNGAAGLEVL